MLFGPTSLNVGEKSSGPRPYGVVWGVHETTPNLIALAAIVVRTPLPNKVIYN